MAASSRPLLPAPPSRDQSGTSGGHSTAARVGSKRQHTAQACVECKKRKTKCDGQRPCQLCIRKATECVYVPNEPQSRLDSLKRDKEELSKTVQKYEAILHQLRAGAVENAIELLHHVRKTRNLDELVELLEHGALLLPNSTDSTESSLSPVNGRIFSASEPESASASAGTSTSSSKRQFTSIEEERAGDFMEEIEDEDNTPRKPATKKASPEVAKLHPKSPEQAEPQPRGNITKERRGYMPPTRLSLSILTGPTFNIRYVANASDWTPVTSDSGLVSHLLSTYFMYQHPFFNWIDEELFLEDLSSGQGNFCCSVLVNAILAASCHLSDQVHGQAEPWDNAFLGKRFYEVALALWREEEGKHNLPNLQAAIMLCHVASHNGEDKKGSNFLSYAINSATNLGLLRDVSVWCERPEAGDAEAKWEKARSVAVWGLFNYSILTSFSLQRAPPFRKPPRVNVPYENDSAMDKLVFRALCTLSVIHNEIGLQQWSEEAPPPGSSPPVETIESMYQRLLAWEASLPSPLLAEPDGNWAASLLQMQFRYITISLFAPCLTTNTLSTDQRFYRERAVKVTDTSIAALRHLVHLYACCHGFAFCPVYMSHMLLFTAGTALEDLCLAQSRSEVGATEAYASLLECIIGLGEMCKRFYLAQGGLKAIHMRADERGVKLSSRARNALEVVSQPDWVSKASHHFRSQYPTENARTPRDPDHARLDNMVKKWNRLAVDDKDTA